MTALKRVKEARHLLDLVEKEAKEHEDDYGFLWGIIQEAVYCQGVINTIVWRCNRINNPGLQSPKEYEPVVHCKDCRMYTPIDENKPYPCDLGLIVNKDDYCSYGERR